MGPRLFKIVILTLQGIPLTFRVPDYTIVKGDFVSFIDVKTGNHKQFHASRCEITDLGGGNS